MAVPHLCETCGRMFGHFVGCPSSAAAAPDDPVLEISEEDEIRLHAFAGASWNKAVQLLDK